LLAINGFQKQPMLESSVDNPIIHAQVFTTVHPSQPK